MGWLLMRLFPEFTEKVVDRVLHTPVPLFFIALALLVSGPVVFILLLITIVGIPFAFLWLLVWFLILMSSTTFTAFAVGNFITTRWWKAAKKSKLKQLAVGAILVSILFAIPMVGWLLQMIAALIGSGAIIKTLMKRKN